MKLVQTLIDFEIFLSHKYYQICTLKSETLLYPQFLLTGNKKSSLKGQHLNFF